MSFPGHDPGLALGPAGELHLAYVLETEAGPRLAYRQLSKPEAEPILVSPPELKVSSRGEVPPALEVLPGGELVVAYTVRLPGRFKGEIRYQRSTDKGMSWGPALLLHDDDQFGSHSFLDSTVTAQGEALFSWLDNRGGEQGLYATTLAEDGSVNANRNVDPITCQCCGTALLPRQEGGAWLAYRDMEAGDLRDISLARSGPAYGGPLPSGAAFPDAAEETSDPAAFELLGTISPDGWKVQGCPHTGPRMTLGDDGLLWVSWFSQAMLAEGRELVRPQIGIYVASSGDGGKSFAPRKALAKVGGGITAISHPELGTLPDGRLVVIYEVTTAEGKTLQARLADPAGETWSPAVEIAKNGVYPRFIRRGDETFLAFTRTGGEEKVIVVRDARSALMLITVES